MNAPALGIVTASCWAVCIRCGKHSPERRLERGETFWFSRERHDCPNAVALADLVDGADDTTYGDSGVR